MPGQRSLILERDVQAEEFNSGKGCISGESNTRMEYSGRVLQYWKKDAQAKNAKAENLIPEWNAQARDSNTGM